MRERTAFPRRVIEGLPNLKLLVTTADRAGSTDLAACAERSVTVCGTRAVGKPTIGITFGLILELTRRIGWENARLKAGEIWQATLGMDLDGKTLGVLGLGTLGKGVARAGAAFGMRVIAWSQNLAPETCREVGVDYVGKETLFRQADIVSVHLRLSDRTRGLVGETELGLMKETGYIVNTSRGPIISEAALLAALSERRIAGAGLDVFDVEPLPTGHPFRRMENVVITPHLGYVTEQNYTVFYPDVVDNIKAWRAGTPVRVIAVG
jgi:D-3-phosphoglycerate dehydrogenase